MHPGAQPKVTIHHSADCRENYANSVQIRASLWDFLLQFATASQSAPDAVTLNTFQGIYLSPLQAKALANLLNQNIAHYESAFGEIRIEPHSGVEPGIPGPIQ